jgi:hypothetical protein
MRVQQATWNSKHGWQSAGGAQVNGAAQLAMIFGSTEALEDASLLADIKKQFPGAYLFGCSTAGEILSTHVSDDSLAVTACAFERTLIKTAEVNLFDFPDSFAAGRALAEKLADVRLKHILVLSDGLKVNGSELVKGIMRSLPPGVTVTGGLSGDGSRFAKTLVCANGAPQSGKVAAIGFLGDRLKIGFGSMGGWDRFGPQRIVTKSVGNVLYELDGTSALSLYKRYLGEHAGGLPATGLLFPLSIWCDSCGMEEPVVRTILAVNEADQSMTFAGDIPQGRRAQLMRANLERLVDGAEGAAKTCRTTMRGDKVDLALLISCVGRKLVLKQRVEEETEAVSLMLPGAAMTGFYSYGEISAFSSTGPCELHNQTMTITTFRET